MIIIRKNLIVLKDNIHSTNDSNYTQKLENLFAQLSSFQIFLLQHFITTFYTSFYIYKNIQISCRYQISETRRIKVTFGGLGYRRCTSASETGENWGACMSCQPYIRPTVCALPNHVIGKVGLDTVGLVSPIK